MKIAFITKPALSEPLGIMYLSAVLKKAGHKTTLIYEKDLFKELEALKPDIVAYSVTTGNHKEYIEINKKIKQKYNVYSIFGGPHPTFYPEMIKEEGVDAICRGEGEKAFLEIIKNQKSKKTIKNQLIQDLDSIPFPDRDLVYEKDEFFKNLKLKRIVATRGCPFQCTYCFNRHYNKLFKNQTILRYRSPKNIIKEIRKLKNDYDVKLIKFVDDTFNMNKKWLKQFCEEFKKENLPFVCNIRANLVTEETIKQLKEANCVLVYMGIETGNEKYRKEVLERDISDEQILNACKLIKKYKIKLVTQNMIGLPGETIDGAFQTILFNAKCKPDFPGFSIFQPYPNTVLANYAIKNNYFDGNFDNINSNYISTTPLNYTEKEKRQFENLFKLATMTVKLPFLAPIIKKLIKLPRNKIFNLIYTGFYGWSQWKIYSIISDSFIDSIKLMKKLREYLFKT